LEKKFLLRMQEDKYLTLTELAGSTSLNQYINQVLDLHIEGKKGRISKMEKIVIGDLAVKDVREAVTVTQQKWYMEVLVKYNIYFFSPTRIVSPMQYILFYGDSSCTPANCISHVGKVSHIYRHVHGSEINSLPELQKLMSDPAYASEISNWGDRDYQIAVLSDVGELPNPIPLTDSYVNHPRIIVNRTVSIVNAFSAVKMDDLFQ
jgi:hypothetical protein